MAVPISVMFGGPQCPTCGDEVVFEPCHRCGSHWTREPRVTPAVMSDGAGFPGGGLYDVVTAYHEEFRDLTLAQLYSLAASRGWLIRSPQ